MTETNVVKTDEKKSLLTSTASQWGIAEVDAKKLHTTLKNTVFKGRKGKDGSFTDVTDEQLITLLAVSKQYNLNPFTKEIYAYPDKQNGIVPVVGIDGWSRIINEHPQLNGIAFEYSPDEVTPPGGKPCPKWIECIITRKDRAVPTRIREYLDECYRQSDYASPWQTHTKRFLRHKAMIQTARIAFGFAGIYDQDEAERIQEGNAARLTEGQIQKTEDLNREFIEEKVETVVDTNEIVDAAAEEEESDFPGDRK